MYTVFTNILTFITIIINKIKIKMTIIIFNNISTFNRTIIITICIIWIYF